MDNQTPQLEDGYVKIANPIMDKFARTNLSSYETNIIWTIILKTYGWNKKEDIISISQFCKATNIRASHVIRTLHKLTLKRIINRRPMGNMYFYSLNKNIDDWCDVEKYNRKYIFERDHYTCTYCLKTFEYKDLEVDHIIPLAKNGSNEIKNLTTSCIKCNRKKSKSTPQTGILPKQGYSQDIEKALPKQGIKALPKQGHTQYIYKDTITKDICNSVNAFITLFKDLNPSYAILYKNKTQRDAVMRLIKQYGEEKLKKMIEYLPTIVCKKYAPRITTPYELEIKMGQLKQFVQQEKNNQRGGVMNL